MTSLRGWRSLLQPINAPCASSSLRGPLSETRFVRLHFWHADRPQNSKRSKKLAISPMTEEEREARKERARLYYAQVDSFNLEEEEGN